MSTILPALTILASILIVVLNYWREVTVRRDNEIYLRKTQYYEDLIDCLNKMVFAEDESRGRELTKLYNKSFIYASDEVIGYLNDFFQTLGGRPTFLIDEIKPIYSKLLLACREDLGLGRIVNVQYVAPSK